MKKRCVAVGILVFALTSFCTGLGENAGQTERGSMEEPAGMNMIIGDTRVEVVWENNASVEALRELAAGGLSIPMAMYGGFEQVGSIGRELPTQDVPVTTSPGDIVLYAGDQIVLFYGTNSWSYTRLGRITDKTPEEMRELLSHGGVTIRLEAE